jgi:putative endonuclease
MPLPFTDLAQFIANRFDRSVSTPAPEMQSSSQIGNYGERVAAAFLRRHGYKILVRNYLVTGGEIDIICRHKDVLVFVEVRTRASADFGRPIETIGSAKQDALRHAARHYLELLGRDDIYYRFDAVEVMLTTGELPVCTLLSDIFA